ncbi:unnamed protein product [Albugo candida]|uniref:HIT-type domain-containing protein n=1 Tax=Albugo candida TaxID=65357 RepID=A0A024G7Y2_9STRA|nr:unnamed protein product [Albugo candida]|eukprot:CCI42853.1 unnamed protein product [Albugo candida]
MNKTVPLRLGYIRTSVKDTRPRVITHTCEDSSRNNRLCSLCLKTASRYTCPKCGVHYCSVSCYQQHNKTCTEVFARDHIVEELRVQDDSQKTRKSFEAILKRTKDFQNKQNRWSAIDEELLDNFENLQLKLHENGQVKYEDLTEAQKEEFLHAVRKGEISKWIPCWEPWWMMSSASYLQKTQMKRNAQIQEIGCKSSQVNESEDNSLNELVMESQRFPTVLFTRHDSEEMPDLMTSLIRGHKEPSKFLRYHLVDMIYAYCLIMRRYNGEWHPTPLDAAEDVYAICTSFSDPKARYSNMEQTLSTIYSKAIVILRDTLDTRSSQSLIADVCSVLSCKVFILDALCDLKTLFHTAKSDNFFVLSSGTTQAKRSSKVQAKLIAAAHKARFFLCWAFHTEEHEFENLCFELKSQMEEFDD